MISLLLPGNPTAACQNRRSGETMASITMDASPFLSRCWPETGNFTQKRTRYHTNNEHLDAPLVYSSRSNPSNLLSRTLKEVHAERSTGCNDRFLLELGVARTLVQKRPGSLDRIWRTRDRTNDHEQNKERKTAYNHRFSASLAVDSPIRTYSSV